MAYIRQKNTGSSLVVVIENAGQALIDHPDLFEAVDEDCSPEAVTSYLSYAPSQ